MAGTGRPGGNPDLVKHQYQPKGKEPLEKVVTVRMSKSLYEKIKGDRPDWQDELRKNLEKIYGTKQE